MNDQDEDKAAAMMGYDQVKSGENCNLIILF